MSQAASTKMSKIGLLQTLVVDDAVGRMTLGIETAIVRSYEADGSKQSPWETKRRFDICMTIFLELRGDLKWTVNRIVDVLPRYLRVKLDGGPYNPEQDARLNGWVEEVDPLLAARGQTSETLAAPEDRPRIILP